MTDSDIETALEQIIAQFSVLDVLLCLADVLERQGWTEESALVAQAASL